VEQTKLPDRLREILAEAQAPQRGFGWNPESWRVALADCPDVLDQLNELPKKINRDEVCRIVTSNLKRGAVLPAFVTAMIWGYGTAGYGPARVRWVLTGVRGKVATGVPVHPDVEARLKDAVQIVRAEGAIEGFRHMNNAGHIKYLGPAFFTKWLYFASAASGPDDARAAPILDKQVKDWLTNEARVRLNIYKTDDYGRYVALLKDWGSHTSKVRTPAQVEKAIFHLATGR